MIVAQVYVQGRAVGIQAHATIITRLQRQTVHIQNGTVIHVAGIRQQIQVEVCIVFRDFRTHGSTHSGIVVPPRQCNLDGPDGNTPFYINHGISKGIDDHLTF